jgi:hypothetical protein
MFLMLSGLFIVPVGGSMVTDEAPTNESLVDTADIIVTCRVISVSVEPHRTVYEFEAIEAIKGTIDKEFRIKTREGTYSFVTPTPVRFDVGQELLLFLVEGDNGYYVLYEYWGKHLLSLVDEEYLDSLRGDYFGSVKNPEEYLVITLGILLSIITVIVYWMRKRTTL